MWLLACQARPEKWSPSHDIKGLEKSFKLQYLSGSQEVTIKFLHGGRISQEAGLAAISDLEASLRSFSKSLETGDGDRVKQEVPNMQQDALTYVGRIEEAMVQGFPFKIPERFDNLPQLKVQIPAWQPSIQGQRMSKPKGRSA